MARHREFNGSYRGEHLNHVAFPLGGIGAGMVCLDGVGTLSHLSLRNHPDLFNEPYAFTAVCVKGAPNIARVLAGPVPEVKIFGLPERGKGAGDKPYGFPRFASASFRARFPFGIVEIGDQSLSLRVRLTGWSPFIPGDADNSSLPVAALEYRFTSVSDQPVNAVFSFNTKNFMAISPDGGSVTAAEKGFVLRQVGTQERPWDRGEFCAVTTAPEAYVNHTWFRGGWCDPQTMAWQDIADGSCVARPPVVQGRPSPGASLFVPFSLRPRQSRTVVLLLSWYVPDTDPRFGRGQPPAAGDSQSRHKPWYAGRFPDIESVAAYWRGHYARLRRESVRFSRCFHDTTLPPEVVEAVAANLTTLKSPTVLRQTDGRLWGWEGCGDDVGYCPGSCTHVWNYAQAVPHLFPALERTLRETEFFVNQDERGHQDFRAALPIGPTAHAFHSAADGQLGGVMKAYREWRICGDGDWLRRLWPRIKAGLDYCIATWDPERRGGLFEPHHNTYDIEFWGPDGLCVSFYAGALSAFVAMGNALGEDVRQYEELAARARAFLETELFDGEYFFQKVQWEGLRAGSPLDDESVRQDASEEVNELVRREGPRRQYGHGCLSDGVLGAWIGAMCGLGDFISPEKVRSHLKAVYKHNFRRDLSAHANPQRPVYALGREAGLLVCTWPKGGRPSLPFPYSDEVWTGFEYDVASHMMIHGMVDGGLEIVRAARRRHDGRVRNPFNEYEYGNWYARAMSSYGLLQGLTGARYDAVSRVLFLKPSIRGDFRSFFCAATGYGVVGVRQGKPFFDIRSGRLQIDSIDYTPCEA